jgi:hypothetical protein
MFVNGDSLSIRITFHVHNASTVPGSIVWVMPTSGAVVGLKPAVGRYDASTAAPIIQACVDATRSGTSTCFARTLLPAMRRRLRRLTRSGSASTLPLISMCRVPVKVSFQPCNGVLSQAPVPCRSGTAWNPLRHLGTVHRGIASACRSSGPMVPLSRQPALRLEAGVAVPHRRDHQAPDK